MQHMPPDILDLIKKSGKQIIKISHEDVQGKEVPTQGKVINDPVDGSENVQP